MPWRKGNRLPLVRETEASLPVAATFDEIKAALGIGYVPLCFRSFACYPKFFEVQWEALKPLLGTREFFDLAARLRAEVYTYVHNYFKIPALGEGFERAQAAPIVDQLAYVDSIALLAMTFQLQAFEGTVGTSGEPHPADRTASTPSPEFVDGEAASPSIRRVLEEMRHSLDFPFNGDEQLALAQWPDLLFAYWRTLKPAVQSIFHEQAIFRMRESAWGCAQEIPVQIDLEYAGLMEQGVDPEDMATLTRLTELLVRGAGSGLLNSTFAKIGLEGGNQVTQLTEIPGERVA